MLDTLSSSVFQKKLGSINRWMVQEHLGSRTPTGVSRKFQKGEKFLRRPKKLWQRLRSSSSIQEFVGYQVCLGDSTSIHVAPGCSRIVQKITEGTGISKRHSNSLVGYRKNQYLRGYLNFWRTLQEILGTSSFHEAVGVQQALGISGSLRCFQQTTLLQEAQGYFTKLQDALGSTTQLHCVV